MSETDFAVLLGLGLVLLWAFRQFMGWGTTDPSQGGCGFGLVIVIVLLVISFLTRGLWNMVG